MGREQVIAKMVEMAKAITGKNTDNWTRKAEKQIWRMCDDWNSEHYGGCYDEAEIFMSEINGESGIDGFCIEDEYFLYEI